MVSVQDFLTDTVASVALVFSDKRKTRQCCLAATGLTTMVQNDGPCVLAFVAPTASVALLLAPWTAVATAATNTEASEAGDMTLVAATPVAVTPVTRATLAATAAAATVVPECLYKGQGQPTED